MIKSIARWVLRRELEALHREMADTVDDLVQEADLRRQCIERITELNQALATRNDLRRLVELVTSPEEVEELVKLSEEEWREALRPLLPNLEPSQNAVVAMSIRHAWRELLRSLLLKPGVLEITWREEEDMGDDRRVLYVHLRVRGEATAAHVLR